MTTDRKVKVREDKLRRMAERQRLVVIKSKRRDPRAADFGTFSLVSMATGAVIARELSLDEVEQYLTR